MSGGGINEAQIAQMVSNYRLTPATLMTKLDPSWIAAPWLQYLSMRIAQTVYKGNCGLCISAPPRHGKSTLVTKALPLWVMENFPTKSVVIATYGEELSTDFSRDIKDFIERAGDVMSVKLRPDVRRVAHFQNIQGGSIKAVGMKGTITGRGADVLIIDDYIKSAEEALSPGYLEGLWNWFTTVARTRLEPGAVVIIVATRWVEQDLHGRIETMQKEKLLANPDARIFYDHVKIPALFLPTKKVQRIEPNGEIFVDVLPDMDAVDMFGRRYNDPLFPERYDQNALLDIKAELTARWFNAMFQQAPDSNDTMVANPDWMEPIEWEDFVRIFNASPKRSWGAGRGWDLASTKDAGDFTAAPLMYHNFDSDETYILDLIHGQYSADGNEREFKAANDKDPQFVQYVVEQEAGASGVYAVKHFKELLPLPRRRVVPSPTNNKKLLRAQPFLAHCENAGGKRKVFYLKAPWNKELFEGFKMFPDGDHDDVMDGLAIVYNQLTGKKPMAGAWGRGPNDPTALKNSRIANPTNAEIARYARQSVANEQDRVPIKRASGATWGRRRR